MGTTIWLLVRAEQGEVGHLSESEVYTAQTSCLLLRSYAFNSGLGIVLAFEVLLFSVYTWNWASKIRPMKQELYMKLSSDELVRGLKYKVVLVS